MGPMGQNNQSVYRFGPVVVDVLQRAVRRDGRHQHLEPQAFDLLIYLLDQRERVVSKEDLLDEVWGDQFVSESALTTRIKEIRQAVGDDGIHQAVIKTHRGHGYRFVAELDGGGLDGGELDGGGLDGAETVPGVLGSGLIGRDRDVAEVIKLLTDSPVVTLVGPGGVGKTALSRAVVDRWANRSSCVVSVDLASVLEPRDVIHAIRRDAGLEDAGLAEEDVLSALAELDALIVVDNCEQVAAEAARLISGITQRSGTSRVIATSRERLGTTREQVWPVVPLEAAAARELLVARAKAVDPSYELAAADEESVDGLLSMLDRLPLAIEMAAARLPSLGVADLVRHLTNRIDLIEAPSRDAAERHRTLPALFEWSENLLEPPARELLTELSVFAGPVSADDIAAVVGADATELALGPLAALVGHSLAFTAADGGPTRYGLLETVRSIVGARRDPDIDRRHVEHISRTVARADTRLRTPDEGNAARMIDELMAEVRVAHAWARKHNVALATQLTASLLHYAYERQWAEPAAWCAPLTDGNRIAPPSFAMAVAIDAANRGEYDHAEELAKYALETPDPRVLTMAHQILGDIGLYRGDVTTARRHGIVMFELGQEEDDVAAWTAGLVAIVLSWLYGGDVDEARHTLRRHQHPPSLSPTSRAWLEYAEGELLAAAGQEREAIDRFSRAIALGESVAARFVVGVARVSSLAAMSRAGDIDQAMAAFSAVLGEYRRTRSMTHAITALRNLIGLMVRAGRDETAMVLLGAVQSADIKTTYGAESEQLLEACHIVEERHGPEQATTWIEQGAHHDAAWALDHAIAALAEH